MKITSIPDFDNAEKQRIVMRVSEDCDLGDYAVLLSAASGEKAASSGRSKAAYWFLDRNINKSDIVVLYTKAGTNSQKSNENGSTSHFFYWGIGKVDFNTDRVALLHCPDYQVFVVK